jgi:hypothetical protein
LSPRMGSRSSDPGTLYGQTVRGGSGGGGGGGGGSLLTHSPEQPGPVVEVVMGLTGVHTHRNHDGAVPMAVVSPGQAPAAAVAAAAEVQQQQQRNHHRGGLAASSTFNLYEDIAAAAGVCSTRVGSSAGITAGVSHAAGAPKAAAAGAAKAGAGAAPKAAEMLGAAGRSVSNFAVPVHHGQTVRGAPFAKSGGSRPLSLSRQRPGSSRRWAPLSSTAPNANGPNGGPSVGSVGGGGGVGGVGGATYGQTVRLPSNGVPAAAVDTTRIGGGHYGGYVNDADEDAPNFRAMVQAMSGGAGAGAGLFKGAAAGAGARPQSARPLRGGGGGGGTTTPLTGVGGGARGGGVSTNAHSRRPATALVSSHLINRGSAPPAHGGRGRTGGGGVVSQMPVPGTATGGGGKIAGGGGRPGVGLCTLNQVDP